MTETVQRALYGKARESLGITDSFQDPKPEKTVPEILLDLMEEFGMLGDDASAKECLEAYLKVKEQEE